MQQRSFGHYDLQGTLGNGGTGVVLRCLNRETGRTAALKIPRAAELGLQCALRREAAVLGRLNRAGISGIVRLLEHGECDETPWYAMDLIEGQSLADWNAQRWRDHAVEGALPSTASGGLAVTAFAELPQTNPDIGRGGNHAEPARAPPLPVPAAGKREALSLALRLTEILEALHEEGVIHGDVTPTNVLLPTAAEPVLIDFGTSLLLADGSDGRERPFSDMLLRGTPGYIAPEVLRGEAPDARSDLYALGCVFYELFTGRRAFTGAHPEEVLHWQLQGAPATAEWPPELEPLGALITQLLQREPMRRPPHAAMLARVLRRLLDEPADFADPRRFRSRLYRPTLQGREEPVERLLEAVTELKSQRGGFGLVVGSSGAGKTRLMNEVGRRAARSGVEVVWCRTARASTLKDEASIVPSEGLQLFRPLLERFAAQRRGAAGLDPADAALSLAALERLTPWIAWRGGESAPGTGDALELGLDALLGALERLAGPSGLLLLIDDLQWADDLSRAFLRRHALALCESRILILANWRAESSSDGPGDLSDLLRWRIDLGPLGTREIRGMAGELLGAESLPEGLLDFLVDRSQGNPLFVTEYTRSALADGALYRSDDGVWTFRSELMERVPQSLDGWFARRLLDISESARSSFRLAAILGREFDAECFAALAPRNVDAREALEELVARELLQPTQPGRYRCAHDQLREAQERALSATELQALHRQVAETLEQRESIWVEDRIGSLGYHWACAGNARAALGYLEAAGAAAQSSHSLERAAALYRLALAQASAEQLTSKRVQLGEALADVLLRLAKHQAARECLEQVLAEAPEPQHLARARVRRKLASSYWTVHEYAAAQSELNLAQHELALSRGEEHSKAHGTELVQIELGRFQRLYFSGETGKELDRLVQTLASMVDAHGTEEQRCSYYFTAASYRLLQNRYAFDAEALALAQRGLHAAEEHCAPQIAMAHFVLAWTLMAGSRDYQRLSLLHFERSLVEAERAGDRTLVSRVRTYQALALLRLDEVQAVAELADRVLEAAEAAQLPPYRAAAYTCQGWVAWRRNDPIRAVERLAEARHIWQGHAHRFPLSNLAIFPLLALATAKDDFAAATTLLSELATGLPALPMGLNLAVARAHQAIESGNAREAGITLGAVLRMARATGFT